MNAQKLFVDNSHLFYQIAPIYEFKKGIVSLTFDDGYITQFTVGLPLMKERKIPATFYIINNNVDSLTRSLILNNISKDYEIGSHTVSHPDLVKIGNAEANQELLNSKLFLQKYFGMNSGLTMAYPWGIYDSSVRHIVEKIYLAARTTCPGFNSLQALERYDLKMQGFGEQVNSHTANSWVDYAIKNKLWLVEMIHGINDVGYSPIDSEVFSEHLDYINTVDDKIWCSSVSNVIKYIDESKNAKIECELCSDTVFKIRINDFMDDSIYNQSLSIRIKVPDNWDSISISNSAKIKTEYYNKSKFILFNALPDNQELTVKPKLISTPENESGMRLVYLSANPFFDNIKLTLEVFGQRNIDVVLCDINGRLLIHQEEKAANGVINLYLDTSAINPGVYFLRVSSYRGDYIIKKLVKI
ncbi:MAG: polysaccharide deacetylase family protein [Bacteroidales bacterium]|nr:polysaccharide deacetylase family protein [Bacteroidales bacterium]